MLRKKSRESEAGMRHLKAKLALLTVLVCLAFASAAYALKPLIFRVEKTIEIEPGFPPAAYQRLARMGHNVKCDLDSATFGRGEMILRTEQGTLVGATEPRADGCVAAW